MSVVSQALRIIVIQFRACVRRDARVKFVLAFIHQKSKARVYQVVGPVQPLPPHCPYCAAPVPAPLAVVLVVVDVALVVEELLAVLLVEDADVIVVDVDPPVLPDAPAYSGGPGIT